MVHGGTIAQCGHFVCCKKILISAIVESQMVIFASKWKETGAKIVAVATSQYTSSCVFVKGQYWRQVSIILIHSFQRYSSFCDLSQCSLTTDDVIDL